MTFLAESSKLKNKQTQKDIMKKWNFSICFFKIVLIKSLKTQNLSGNKLINSIVQLKISLLCYVPGTLIQYHAIVQLKQKIYKPFLHCFSFYSLLFECGTRL
jgi:hypothetical protein